MTGSAPVPNAGLALILTTYNTVFSPTTGGAPDGFGYIFAVDWFMDRGRSCLNVTGDCFVTGIISAICPLVDIVEKEGDERDQDLLNEEQPSQSHSQSHFTDSRA